MKRLKISENSPDQLYTHLSPREGVVADKLHYMHGNVSIRRLIRRYALGQVPWLRTALPITVHSSTVISGVLPDDCHGQSAASNQFA